MEKIKITSSDQFYEIKSIRQTAEHVLQIVFAGAVPESWGDIQLYTEGGVLATILIGWHTVYRNEGKTVYLSDDGSVYVPPADLESVTPSEPYEPTLAELQASKKAGNQRGVRAGNLFRSGCDIRRWIGGALFSDRTRSAQFIRQAGAACGWRGTVGIPFRWTGLPILQRHRYAVDHHRGDAVCIVSHYLLQCHQYVDLRMREYKRTPGNLLRSGYSGKVPVRRS